MPYRKHLSKDKILKGLIKKHGAFELKQQPDILVSICKSVIGQQLSTKVASIISERFIQLLKGRKASAANISSLPFEQLRAIGLSNSKATYILNVCHFFVANKLTNAKLHKMKNEELLALLTQIKGIGQWTVEMTLMFTLAREDVFSTGDYGIQKAMVQLYNINFDTKKELIKKMNEIADTWSPYRTYACRHLWQSLNSV